MHPNIDHSSVLIINKILQVFLVWMHMCFIDHMAFIDHLSEIMLPNDRSLISNDTYLPTNTID